MDMLAAINVGSRLESDQLREVAETITAVATSSPFEDVNLAALETFRSLTQVNGAVISNNVITVNPEAKTDVDSDGRVGIYFDRLDVE